MTYQTAYKLLVAAYKSAKGVMPQGIDMLKLKMKARQKVIDAKKVIEVNFDKGNNWMKAKPQSTKVKGKAAETEAEMIVRMNRQNKESVARLKEKKEKSLGEKLKDYDGDPDAMAGGGKVKKPFRSKVVDFLGGPSVVGAELGLSGLLEVYNLLGMPLMKDGGIMELATGGMTNISDTYDNNPTLQAQYPNKQDYLDLFTQQTTTTTPQTNTTTQSTTSTIAPINPIKPIIPLSESGDGGGGITTIDKGLTVADQYGFGPYGNNFNDPDVQDEIDALNPGGVKGFMQGIGNFYTKVSPFLNAKKVLAKGQDFALDIIQKAKEAREKELQRKINESIARESGSNSYQSQAAAHESKVGRSSGERMGRV